MAALARLFHAVQMLLLLSILLKDSTGESSNRNLTFMFVTSFGEFGLNSSGVVPAANIALEDINSNPDLLPGYNLVFDQVRDSEVSILRLSEQDPILYYMQKHNVI